LDAQHPLAQADGTEAAVVLDGHVTTDRGLGGVTAICAADGGELVSAGKDGNIIVWDVATGTKKAELDKGHFDAAITNSHVVAAVAPAPGGIVSAGWDKSAIEWELPSGTLKRKLKGHQAAVLGASPPLRLDLFFCVASCVLYVVVCCAACACV
jgi:WD40 repeat protein